MVTVESDIRTLIVPSSKIRQRHHDEAAVPVLGYIPAGSVLVSSFWDDKTGDLHIHYRAGVPNRPEMEAPEEPIEGPGPVILRASARIVPIERVAMVAHELIRSYRIAVQADPAPPWNDLGQRDKLAEMGRCAALREADLTIRDIITPANNDRAPRDIAIDRVEQTLRACAVQAFNLTT